MEADGEEEREGSWGEVREVRGRLGMKIHEILVEKKVRADGLTADRLMADLRHSWKPYIGGKKILEEWMEARQLVSAGNCRRELERVVTSKEVCEAAKLGLPAQPTAYWVLRVCYEVADGY